MGFQESETVNFLTKRPRWMKCMIVTSLLLIITLSSVVVGAVVGYMYCYIEHHSGIVLPGNTTQSTKLQIVNLPLPLQNHTSQEKRTINGALMRSVLVTKILSLGHNLFVDELPILNDRLRFL